MRKKAFALLGLTTATALSLCAVIPNSRWALANDTVTYDAVVYEPTKSATGSALAPSDYPEVPVGSGSTGAATGGALTTDKTDTATGGALGVIGGGDSDASTDSKVGVSNDMTVFYDLEIADDVSIGYDSEYIYINVRYKLTFEDGEYSHLEVKVLDDACLICGDDTLPLTAEEPVHIWDFVTESIEVDEDGLAVGTGRFELKAPMKCGAWLTDINIAVEVVE